MGQSHFFRRKVSPPFMEPPKIALLKGVWRKLLWKRLSVTGIVTQRLNSDKIAVGRRFMYSHCCRAIWSQRCKFFTAISPLSYSSWAVVRLLLKDFWRGLLISLALHNKLNKYSNF
jgi:hypothetical protein